MNVFVLNCGSSSIKYRLVDMADESVVVDGMIERLATDEARLRQSTGSARSTTRSTGVTAPDHGAGLRVVLAALTDDELGGPIGDLGEIDAVGHRVVHGGADVTASARVDDDVIDVIRRHVSLAPVHNPANLAGIEAAVEAMPSVPHVAVFDTAFFTTLPPRAHRYVVPTEWYADHGVRRYGFHGTSHRFVTGRASELMGRPVDEIDLITCHLGNGCSITAVRGGRAVDHSMGMTPLAGLMMGTRSGDVDPAVVLHLLDRGLTAEEIGRSLNHESGLFAVSGGLRDMRDVVAAADRGDNAAELALDMFVYQVAKFVGAYHLALGRLDAVVMTGGIGENAVEVRTRVAATLEPLGVEIDDAANRACVGGIAGCLTSDDSAVAMWCVPTDEQLMIARDTVRIAASPAAGPSGGEYSRRRAGRMRP